MDNGEVLERLVLDITSRFVEELGLGSVHGPVQPGDSLERDLGLGSLERIELGARVEAATGLRLSDRALAEADSVRDLARAAASAAAGARVTATAPERPALRPPSTGAAPAPAHARTLVDVLRWHAESTPDRTHVVLVDEDEHEQTITYGSLWQRATAVASQLSAAGVAPGDRVALMLRTERAFFEAFFAVLVGGAIPVPIYPPFRLDRLAEYALRQASILDNAGARLLLTFAEAARVAHVLRRRVATLTDVTTLAGLPPASDGRPGAPPASETAALIQYTSGSTGDPKGVLLSHANLLANIRAFGQALGIGDGDIGVSWLPLYHDMGLIGTWLGALYHGVPVVVMPPLAFLARPARWLRALHAHGGTVSAAPNFAYDLCVRRVRDDEIAGLDLSRWRLALNGSETVSAETLRRFAERFAPYGFRPEALCPVYGLAECAVALTVPPLARLPRVDRLARDVFERTHRAQPAAPGDGAVTTVVSCGRPLPGHEVRVVDAAGAPVVERVEGRVQFRGPSVMRGYFRQPVLTQASVREGWMDSGDLGYQADGELFITGRVKDLIIKAGRNLYPHEVEALAAAVPGIRKGCVAAFGLADPSIGTERLVVVAESRRTDPADVARLRSAVADAVLAALGVPPDTVVVAPPGAVRKTSSGKIRRSATREAFARGRLTLAGGRRQRAALLAADARARLGRAAAAAVFAARVAGALAVALPVLWALVHALPASRVDGAVRRWCRTILRLAGCPVVVEAASPPSGPAVYAANHASYLDAVVLLAALPADFRFVAKRELATAPLVGTVIRRAGHLTVERGAAATARDAVRLAETLRCGRSLVVFPEGTFVRAAGLLPFRLGAFQAALAAARPVIPVAIQGTREILPAGAWRPRRGIVRLVIGPPVAAVADGWRAVVDLRDRTRAAIGSALQAAA